MAEGGFTHNQQWIGPEEAEELLDFDIAVQMNEEGPLNPGVNPFRVPGITSQEKDDYCKILQTKLQELKNEVKEVKIEEGNAGKFRRARYLRYSDENVLSIVYLLIGYLRYLIDHRSLGSLRHDIDIETPQEEHYNNSEKGTTLNIKYGRRCCISTFIMYLILFAGVGIWLGARAQVVWRLPPLVVPVDDTEIIFWDCWAPEEPACQDFLGTMIYLKANVNISIQEGPTLGNWAREIWSTLFKKATRQCRRGRIWRRWNETITGPLGCANNTCYNISVVVPDYQCYVDRVDTWLQGKVNISLCLTGGKMLYNKETRQLSYCTDPLQIPLINYTFGPNQTCMWNTSLIKDSEIPKCGWWNQVAYYDTCKWEEANVTFQCHRTQSQSGSWIRTISSWKQRNRWEWRPDFESEKVKISLQCNSTKNLTFAMRSSSDYYDVQGAWIEFGCHRNKSKRHSEARFRIRCKWNEGNNISLIDTCGTNPNVTGANPVDCTMKANTMYNCSLQDSFTMKIEDLIVHFNMTKAVELYNIAGNWSCTSDLPKGWGYMNCNCTNGTDNSETKMACPKNQGILRNWYNPVAGLRQALIKYQVVKQPEYLIVPEEVMQYKFKQKRAAIHIMLALATVLSMAGAGTGATAIGMVTQYHQVLATHQQALEKITEALKINNLRLITLEHQVLVIGLRVEAIEKFLYTAFAMQELGCNQNQFFCKIPPSLWSMYNMTLNQTIWNHGNISLGNWYNQTRDLQNKFYEIIMDIEQNNVQGKTGIQQLQKWENWVGWIGKIPQYLKGLLGSVLGIGLGILLLLICLPTLVDCIRNCTNKILGYTVIAMPEIDDEEVHLSVELRRNGRQCGISEKEEE
uniref:Envelope glycoprotein gp150 n=1 Tax=Feline immunodeficiency virus (isolate TM2) TaxID=31676 RepID=ENV_FIVT2|nr:RecName: Full=Envelope glycoprotein gp150; AltName: Full=Env polyprotein; Contains: RecName: Full=Surface protein; Short=SU; AltName: Full=Glycoprotein 100; Short=gp100; Contains: RecName: Full=Transmembrane protein; Short=TM; AltName: Full=Glycoprotein 36; Short=gp36 [Feline immunodeficiency virus (isolate TM2)]AAA43074.1 envelope polyprotein [Feline immunodeficiency virus]